MRLDGDNSIYDLIFAAVALQGRSLTVDALLLDWRGEQWSGALSLRYLLDCKTLMPASDA